MINHITSSAISQHTPLVKGRSDVHVENQVSKPSHETSLTNEASQRILNDKIIEKLDKVLQKNGAESVRTVDAANYTPDAVSNRILSFVQEAIDRAGARGENQRALMEQARAGVDKGFEEAENILTSLNALSGVIAENVHKTYQKIQDGLSDMVNRLKGLNESNASKAFQATTHTSSQSLDLEIKTRDGDTLKLSLSRDESTGQYTAHVSNPNGKASYEERHFELNSDFALSVEGSLDESEVAAIEELLSGVKGVAEEFFNGNSEAALEAGLGLGYNASEIASFSLSLNESQTSSVTKAYQEVSYLGSNQNQTRREALNNLLKPVNGFLNSAQSVLNKAEQVNIFGNSKSSVEDLLDFFAKSDAGHKPAIDSLEAKAGAPFKNVVHDLISHLSA